MTSPDAQAMLKACPFCGGPATNKFYGDEDGGYHCVECRNGGGHFAGAHCETEVEAIAAWNTRTIPAQPSSATEVREAKWARWPQGDAGDAIDFACDHAKEPVFFMEDWRSGRADEWPEYMLWLKVQRDGALAAQVTE